MKLYPHQEQCLNDTADKTRVAYYLDMGLGKTYVGAEKLIRIRNKVNLVICQKSKINDWIEHFREYYHNWKTEDGTSPKFNPKGVNIIVINYDIAFRRTWTLELTDFTLMLDESSLVKNDSSKRTKSILRLKPSAVILLSGTPTGGKYEELYSQLKLLGWNITKSLFINQYTDWEWADYGGYFTRRITGYKNVDRLKQKLRYHGAIFMKTEEVLDLPKQNHNVVKVTAPSKYKQFMKNGIIAISDDMTLVGDTTLTKLLYARQLCGSYSKTKLTAFEDLVDSTDDRLIVFYNFNDELNAMLKVINDRPYSLVNGQTKDLTAYEECNDSITFIQYQAGAMGLNLQKSNKIVYFTLPLSSEVFEQSKKRIHRIGQTEPCFYYYLISKGTVEERILKTLKMRKNYTDELFKEEDDA